MGHFGMQTRIVASNFKCPAIMHDGVAVLAHFNQCGTQIDVGRGVVRFQPQGLTVMVDCLFQTLLGFQSVGQCCVPPENQARFSVPPATLNRAGPNFLL